MRSTMLTLLLLAVWGSPSCSFGQYPESRFPVRPVPAWPATATWQLLGEDPVGDGLRTDGGDGKALSFYFDTAGDTLWFRVDVADQPDSLVALSVSFDLDDNQGTGLFWYGSNRSFIFDKMISVGLLRREGSFYVGYNGFSTADGVRQNRYLTEKLGAIAFVADAAHGAYFVGVARKDLGDDVKKVRAIASVGHNARWNDDLINQGSALLVLRP